MEVRVPDIGDFADVPVIEILVSAGDAVAIDAPLVTLESDKATMDVPAPAAGIVTEVLVALNDRVSEGSLLLNLEPAEGEEPEPQGSGTRSAEPQGSGTRSAETPEPAQAQVPDPQGLPGTDRQTQVLVVGAGPGGYTAAFRAADLGLRVTMVERYESLGGVCLNVGCIPSKALLHAAKVIDDAKEAEGFGVAFGEPQVDLERLRTWKEEVVGKLTGGLGGLAKQRKVEVVTGTLRFTGPHTAEVDGTSIAFEHCILAAGSRAVMLPGLPDDERIVDSTGALDLGGVPDRLLVIGGGIIGLELGGVYAALGSSVEVVELTDGLMPGCDRDLVKPLQRRLDKSFDAIRLSTKVAGVEAGDDGLRVSFEGDGAPEPQTYDRVLVAVGRRANGDGLGLEEAGVEVDERGEVAVDAQRRTNVPHIFAIGDLTGAPMLAHKASHEGVVAAEVIAGRNVAFEPRAIPSVAYTDPEVAWAGVTEIEAEAEGIPFEKAVFGWQASGRALSIARAEGLTKLLVDPESRRVIGAGITGTNAGELIAEAVLAIEMGADAEDVGLTIHAHPTLSETVMFAAEVAEGTVTDIYAPKRPRS